MAPSRPRSVVERNTAVAEDLTKDLRPIEIQAVNGFRHRVAQLLQRVGIVTAIGAGAGYGAGHFVEGKYHDWTGFSHEPAALVAPAPEADSTLKADALAPIPENETTIQRLTREAREDLRKVKKRAMDGIKKATDSIELMKEYQELKAKYDAAQAKLSSFKKMALEMGDKLAFWGSFLMAFSTVVILATGIIALKKKLTQGVDPAVEANLKALAATANALITRVNALSESGVATQAEIAEIRRIAEGLPQDPLNVL